MRIYLRLGDALGPTVAQAFDDLTVRTETVLTGDVADEAALHGLIARCRDLGIPMLDLHVESPDSRSTAQASDVQVSTQSSTER